MISELNVWIKLGFHYWIKPGGGKSIATILEEGDGELFSVLFFTIFTLYSKYFVKSNQLLLNILIYMMQQIMSKQDAL